jgi:hypothetical protein
MKGVSMDFFVTYPGMVGGFDSYPFMPLGDTVVGGVSIDLAFNLRAIHHLQLVDADEYFVLPKTHEAFPRLKNELSGTASRGGEILSIISYNPNGLFLHVRT